MPNPLTNFRFNRQDLLPEAAKKSASVAAIDIVRARIRSAKDISDAQATPYSPRGPIYIPMVSGLRRWNANDPHRGYLRGVGYNKHLKTYGLKRSFVSFANSSGQSIDGYSRSGNSLRFMNWKHYKQYIGHSGGRDLEVTGKLLNSILVTQVQQDFSAIGFLDDTQEVKMRGNQRYSAQWGFSPNDENLIGQAFQRILDRYADAIFRKLCGG